MYQQEPIPDSLVILGSCGSTRETYWTVKEVSPHTRVVFVADDITENTIEFPGESAPIIHDWDFAAVRKRVGGGDPGAYTQFVCGMGSPRIKKIMVERALQAGLRPAPSIVSQKAHVSPDARIGRGGIIKPLSTVQNGCRLGDFVSVFIGILGHDALVGDFATIGANAVVAGDVVIKEGVCLGLGVSVRQHLTLGPWVEAGMGAIVVRDVIEPGVTVVGNPAKELRTAPVVEIPRISQEGE